MSGGMISTIITILGSILIVSVTYFLTKRRELEVEWRKEKLSFYIDFIKSISGITDNEWSEKNVRQFAKSCNNLYLFAPKSIIDKLLIFLEETDVSNNNKSYEKYTKALTELINEIRKDIRVSKKSDILNVILRTGVGKIKY